MYKNFIEFIAKKIIKLNLPISSAIIVRDEKYYPLFPYNKHAQILAPSFLLLII